jgi:hypothetical protein
VAVSALASTGALADDGGGLNLNVTFAYTDTYGVGGGEAIVKDAGGNTSISQFAGVESVASITPGAYGNTDLSVSIAGVQQSITASNGVDFAKVEGGGHLDATNIVATGSVTLPRR